MKKILTLCIVHQSGQVLLGMKKRGFGVGRWNGFGGKVESGESIEEAARRELQEEVGITAKDLTATAVIDFTFASEREQPLEVHVFSVTDFTGEPTESEEMEPDWFVYGEIPYGQMWADDIHWLPHVLTGQKFTARFHMDKPATADYASTIINFDIDVVNELPSEQMPDSEAGS